MNLSSKQRAVVDESGALKREAAAFKPKLTRIAKLDEEMASWFAKKPADESFFCAGNLYDLEVSARANERKITDLPGIFAALGKTLFLKSCTFTLKRLEAFFTGADLDKYVTEEQTGRRTIRPVARPPTG